MTWRLPLCLAAAIALSLGVLAVFGTPWNIVVAIPSGLAAGLFGMLWEYKRKGEW